MQTLEQRGFELELRLSQKDRALLGYQYILVQVFIDSAVIRAIRPLSHTK